jgi:hypothetical protein
MWDMVSDAIGVDGGAHPSSARVGHPALGMGAGPFPAGCGPVRLDFYPAIVPEGVVAEARPEPVFRLGDKPAGHWVSTDVTKLLSVFFRSEDVEVVVAGEPERAL